MSRNEQWWLCQLESGKLQRRVEQAEAKMHPASWFLGDGCYRTPSETVFERILLSLGGFEAYVLRRSE